jgi:hypothetical protein
MPKWPAPDRVDQVAGAVRGYLQAGDGHRAVNTAIVYALQAAAAHRRALSPNDAALADAELAAELFATAELWHHHRPEQEPGRSGPPVPSQLVARFDTVRAKALSEAAEPEGTRR